MKKANVASRFDSCSWYLEQKDVISINCESFYWIDQPKLKLKLISCEPEMTVLAGVLTWVGTMAAAGSN